MIGVTDLLYDFPRKIGQDLSQSLYISDTDNLNVFWDLLKSLPVGGGATFRYWAGGGTIVPRKFRVKSGVLHIEQRAKTPQKWVCGGGGEKWKN